MIRTEPKPPRARALPPTTAVVVTILALTASSCVRVSSTSFETVEEAPVPPASAVPIPASTTAIQLGGESRPPAFPDGFDIGPDLLTRPDRPYIQLEFEGGLVFVTTSGETLGHEIATASPPQGELLPEGVTGEWPVPERCVLDGPISDTEVRVVCEPEEGPGTFEALSANGDRRIIGKYPDPPADIADAFGEGQGYWPAVERAYASAADPDVLLVQLRAECETRLAAFVRGGEIGLLDGSNFWDYGSDGESEALGWLDGSAIVRHFSGLCSSETPIETGIHAYDPSGERTLMFELPDGVSSAQLITD